MKKRDLFSGKVGLRRIAINTEMSALLKAESERLHIPIQDLVGSAIVMAMAFQEGQRSEWVRVAAHLRDARTNGEP